MENIWKKYSSENTYGLNVDNSFRLITENDKKEFQININHYKFPEIFLSFSDEEHQNEDYQHTRLDMLTNEKNAHIVNLIFHYIANIDMYNALSYEDIKKLEYLSYIKNGNYGNFVRDNFSKLSEIDRNIILQFLTVDSKINLYEDVLKAAFENVVTYYMAFNSILHIATTEAETEYSKTKLEICRYLFKDIFLKDEIIFSCRPAIFNETQTIISSDFDRADFGNII